MRWVQYTHHHTLYFFHLAQSTSKNQKNWFAKFIGCVVLLIWWFITIKRTWLQLSWARSSLFFQTGHYLHNWLRELSSLRSQSQSCAPYTYLIFTSHTTLTTLIKTPNYYGVERLQVPFIQFNTNVFPLLILNFEQSQTKFENNLNESLYFYLGCFHLIIF